MLIKSNLYVIEMKDTSGATRTAHVLAKDLSEAIRQGEWVANLTAVAANRVLKITSLTFVCEVWH